MMKNLEDYYILNLSNEILKDFDEDQGSPFSDFLKLSAVDNIDHLRNEFEKLKIDLRAEQMLNLIEEEVDPNLFSKFWALNKGNFDWSFPFLYKQFIPIKHLISDKVVAKELEQFIITAAGGHLKKRHLDFEDQVKLMNDLLVILNILHDDISNQFGHNCKHENFLNILERNSFHRHVMEGYEQFIAEGEKKENEDTITLSEAIRLQVKPGTADEDYSEDLKTIEGLREQELIVEINFKKPNDRSAYQINFDQTLEKNQIIEVVYNHFRWKHFFATEHFKPRVDENIFIRDWINKLLRFISDNNVKPNKNFSLSKNQAVAVGSLFVLLGFGKAPDPEYGRNYTKPYSDRLSNWVTSKSGWNAE